MTGDILIATLGGQGMDLALGIYVVGGDQGCCSTSFSVQDGPHHNELLHPSVLNPSVCPDGTCSHKKLTSIFPK